MIAKIDEEICIGCGICADICPKVFHIEDDISKTICDNVPSKFISDSKEAEENCPVKAISLI